MKDFAPVALVAIQPNILVVNPSAAGRLRHGIDRSRKDESREAELRLIGRGAAAHLAGELFKAMAGVDMVHVPYKGAQPALTDLHRRAGAARCSPPRRR